MNALHHFEMPIESLHYFTALMLGSRPCIIPNADWEPAFNYSPAVGVKQMLLQVGD